MRCNATKCLEYQCYFSMNLMWHHLWGGEEGGWRVQGGEVAMNNKWRWCSAMQTNPMNTKWPRFVPVRHGQLECAPILWTRPTPQFRHLLHLPSCWGCQLPQCNVIHLLWSGKNLQFVTYLHSTGVMEHCLIWWHHCRDKTVISSMHLTS